MQTKRLLVMGIVIMMITSGFGLMGFGDLISGLLLDNSVRSGDDSYEENDNSSAAATITVGTHTNLQCLDDDWYKIRLTTGTDLTVTIDFTHADGDLDLELYASDRTSIMDRSHGTTDSEIVEVGQLALTGELFIRVYGWMNATGAYNMTLSTSDITLPVITGLTASPVSDSIVSFSWTTSEPCNHIIWWGTKAGMFTNSRSNAGYVTNHATRITGLAGSSLYNYKVICEDRAGNSVESGPHYFETNAKVDSEDPEIQLTVPSLITEPVVVRAIATDNTGVEKVEFYLDDVYQLADHKKYYEWVLDPAELTNGPHTITVKAYDLSGRTATDAESVRVSKPVPDRTPPAVNFLSTFKKNKARGGSVPLDFSMMDADSGVEKVVLYINGEHKWTAEVKGEAGITEQLSYDWNTYGGDNNAVNEITVVAYNNDGIKSESSYDVFVDNPTDALPSGQGLLEVLPLDITRGQVKREGTWYEVKLSVKNIGSKELYDVKVEDISFGFQTVSSEYGYQQKASYNRYTRETSITFPLGSLKPGETKTMVYNMVPVLFAPDPRVGFVIGDRTVVTYLKSPYIASSQGATPQQAPPKQVSPPKATFYAQAVEMVPSWWATNTIPITDWNILAPMDTRDYLVVTHPANLYYQYVDSEVDELLSDLAVFSKEKNAVLGYLTQYGGDMVNELKNAISPFHFLDWDTGAYASGGWNKYLISNWEYTGYLLIVGEGEIVPSVNFLLYVWSEADKEFKENFIPQSDHYYSDLLNGGDPDVVVGRLIGDSPAVLRKAIDTSLGVHKQKYGYDFDGSDALVISGIGNYYPSFIDQVNTIGDSLEYQGVNVLREHREQYAIIDDFTKVVSNPDVVGIGNLGGTDDAEIVMADESSDKIRILLKSGYEITDFYHDFDPGDLMAVGDVTGDDRAEIVIADISHNKIYIYKAYFTTSIYQTIWDKGLLKTQSVTLDYDDKMALGDLKNDAKDDIVISDDSANKLVIYSFSGSNLVVNYVMVPVPDPHGLAVGDVDPGGKDEVVIAEDALIIHLAHIYVYDSSGNQIGKFGSRFNEPEDRIAIGDSWDSNDQDIIIKNKREETIYFYYIDANTNWNDPHEHWTELYFDFADADDMAVGQLVPGGNVEILIADAPANQIFYYNTLWFDRFRDAFHADSPNKDVIYMAVHGGPQVWGSGVQMNNLPSDFGGTNPFVVAFSCSTGHYEWVDANDDFQDEGIAEAFIEKGAGVYIGATRMTNTGTNAELGKTYFEYFYNSLQAVGRSYNNLERHAWNVLAGTHENGLGFWRATLAYNIYGDPKFKAEENNNLPQIDPEAFKYWKLKDLRGGTGGASASLIMGVPDYEVTEFNGTDLVDIPGGNILLAREHYRVPYYYEAVEIPEGYQVQDVKMTSRGNLSTVSGLNLPKLVMRDTVSQEPFGDAPKPYIEPGREWYPYEDFRWTVTNNPNGTSTLFIIVYPFQVDQKTQDARFYSRYLFSIDFMESNVEITNLHAENLVYDFTDPVNIDVMFDNSGTSASNVIVSTEIVSYNDVRTFGGLELQSLNLHTGSSQTTLTLNPRDLEAGNYNVKVELMDLSGNLLDTEIVSFHVGVTRGEITNFGVSSEFYEDGDPIAIDFEFPNTGSTIINGVAVISIKDENGETAAEFNQSIRDLAPSETASVGVVWDTTGAEGKYFVTGRVYYDGKCALSDAVELNDYESAIENIIDEVNELNPPGGLKNSLQSKLDNAIKLIDLGKYGPAANLLEAFINEVEAQRSKIFNDAEADELVESTGKILDALNKAGG